MELLEQVDRYQQLLEEKGRLKELADENAKQLQTQRDALAQIMLENEVTKINRSGFTYSLKSGTKFNKKAGCDETLFQLLREEGLGDLIKETVNANTLQGAISSMVEERGELPEAFSDCINVYEYVDIARRKDTNKALI